MKLFLILCLASFLNADVKQTMLNLYQQKDFEASCNLGYKNFSHNREDEDYISLYAFSCLHANNLNRLSIPIYMLKKSRESRANSAYLSVIIMQKQLLFQALLDGYDFSGLQLPTTDYILSKVFDFYLELGVHQRKSFYIFTDKNDRKLTYKLSLSKNNRSNKIIIEEFYDSTRISKHIYR